MRLTGPRRGNPALRFMIEQASRRRMWSALDPAQSGEAGAPQGPVARWSPAFFDRLHASLLPRMAPVTELPEGQLRYLGTTSLRLWALVSEHHLALAYEREDSLSQVRERARRWLGCLTSRTAPGLASPYWGHPIYGARRDPLSGELEVVWALPGEWCDAVWNDTLPALEWDAPVSWAQEAMAAQA